MDTVLGIEHFGNHQLSENDMTVFYLGTPGSSKWDFNVQDDSLLVDWEDDCLQLEAELLE